MAFSLKQLASGMFSRVLLNSNFQDIEHKVNSDLLHRDGTGSSVMKKDLDMNGKAIINIGELKSTEGDTFAELAKAYSEESSGYAQKSEDHSLDSKRYAESSQESAALSDSYQQLAQTSANTAITIEQEVSQNIVTLETLGESVISAQAQTNAFLGLGIGSSYVDTDGHLIMGYEEFTVSVPPTINSNGRFILEYEV